MIIVEMDLFQYSTIQEKNNLKNMYLFFDTETTGLPMNYGAPASDLENWPRLVQLAYIATDEQGNILRKRDYIIKPEGFIIPEESSNIHRITTEIANEKGMILEDVLYLFLLAVRKSKCLVAHNISFDEKIMDAEFIRNGYKEPILKEMEQICTMKSTTNFCALPNNKWPRLQELHMKLFGEEFEEAHNALADIEATMKCFFELKKLKVI